MWLTFWCDSHEKSMSDDVKFLRSVPYFKGKVEVLGYLFDIKTGQLKAMEM